MNKKYEFFIAGRTRNKEKILDICTIFDRMNISYYCFLKNEQSHVEAGLDLNESPEELMKKFENMSLESDAVKTIFNHDMEGLKMSENILLVLPAGKSAHIEAGVAYGLGKKCYAIGEYDVTDSLYLIFNKIFADNDELAEFLQLYN
ncbi:MAG: hypothetical protein LBL91_00285 [Lachnospiraceae bacterium]|jgi:hypothetical protein|nr:hypothetical protein [Lachnospiraceae bacterium]